MKQIGWFDLFRENGGPTWYGENRTPVVADTTTVGIVALFAVFLAAFIIILPGIRKQVTNHNLYSNSCYFYIMKLEYHTCTFIFLNAPLSD